MSHKKEIKEKKNKNSDLPQRLAQGSLDGLVMEVFTDAIIPGTGLALNAVKGIKGAKKVAKIAAKGSAKEGIKILDGEPESENKLEDLSEDLAMEVIGRSLGR